MDRGCLQLFRILALPDFPVNRKTFAHQLLVQARRYKRDDMVASLVAYLGANP